MAAGDRAGDDVEAIRQLKYRYFRFLDLKRFEELGRLLTEDATASYEDGRRSYDGRAAIVAFLTEALGDPGIVTQHNGHHPEVTLTSPSTATGTWYLHDRVIVAAHDLEIGGTAFYHDEYAKAAGGWRIRHTGYQRVFEERRTHRTHEVISFSSCFSPDPGPGSPPGPDRRAGPDDRSTADVLNELIDVLEDARHAEWITPPGPLHQEFEQVFHFLVEELHELSEAAGPSADAVAGVAGRSMRNVAAEAHGVPARAALLIAGELEHLAARVRGTEALTAVAPTSLGPLADGLDQHVARLSALAAEQQH